MKKIKSHAKLNLFLEVTGKRPNGYHELYSLAIFLDLADEIAIQEADEISCVSEIDNNICLKAASKLQQRTGCKKGCKISISKNIPVGSGLGGGSANAASTLVELNELWNLGLPQRELMQIGLELGADVPVCLYSILNNKSSAFFEGIGEKVSACPILPELYLVLVNPNESLSTQEVFKSFDTTKIRQHEAFEWSDTEDFFSKLASRNNDLEPASKKLRPSISVILDSLSSQNNCYLARMSGSGATCFGLYQTLEDAELAANNISKKHPEWFVKTAKQI